MRQSETIPRLDTLSAGRNGAETARAATAPLPSGWICLRNCNISGSLNHPVQIHYVLLHPEVGMALLDVAPAVTPDAEAILRQRLEAVRFEGIFQGYLPIVYRRILPSEASAIDGILHDAFAALPPLTLAGGDAWVTVMQRALLPRDPARAAAPSGAPGARPGGQARRAEPPADRPSESPTLRSVPMDPAPPAAAEPEIPQAVEDSGAAVPTVPPRPAPWRLRPVVGVAAGLGTAAVIFGLAAVMGGHDRPAATIEEAMPPPAVAAAVSSPDPMPSQPGPDLGNAGTIPAVPQIAENPAGPGAPSGRVEPAPARLPPAQAPVHASPGTAAPLPAGSRPGEAPAVARDGAAAAGAQSPPAGPTSGGQDAGPRVVVRSPANLRTGPNNSYNVLRVAPRGESFRVYGHAPGGWTQVGDSRASGWIHSSLLTELTP